MAQASPPPKTKPLLGQLPALPNAVWSLLRMTQDDNTALRDLEKVITSDPALTSTLLRMANSAYYGIPRQVTRLSEALAFLGMKTIRGIALTIGTFGVFTDKDAHQATQRQQLWHQALRCGVATKAIAGAVGYDDVEAAFLAGLLHDIGIQVTLFLNHDAFIENEALYGLPVPDLVAEREACGFDHVEVGQLVCEEWHLPDELIDTVAHHHDPVAAAVNPRLASLVYVADAVLYQLDHSVNAHDADNPNTLAGSDIFLHLSSALDAIGLPAGAWDALVEPVANELGNSVELFAAVFPDSPPPRGAFEPGGRIPPPNPALANRLPTMDAAEVRRLEQSLDRPRRVASPWKQFWALVAAVFSSLWARPARPADDS